MRRFGCRIPTLGPLLAGFLCGCLGLTGWMARATAQDARPTTTAYLGPNCFTALWEDTLQFSGRVIGGRQARQITFSEEDAIFVQPRDQAVLGAGETYQLVRLEGQVSHPSGGEAGTAISMVGLVEILETSAERSIGRIKRSCETVEVGDWLWPIPAVEIPSLSSLPPFDPARLIEPRTGDATVLFGYLETIVDDEGDLRRRGMALREALAGGDTITIDQGSVDGWRGADVAIFYESEEDPILPGQTKQRVPRVLGRGVVFWVQPHSVTLLVTDGDVPIRVGTSARRVAADGSGS